jgi:two-component system, cell cycle response regulator
MRRPVVMVVEDSVVTRAVIRRRLGAEDVEIVEAVDGQDAIDQLERVAPDVVLCDVEMPRVDGHGVLRWLREHPVLSSTPVVFLTAIDSVEDAVRALDGGAYDYLRKPFEPVELVSRVRAALRTRHLQDELRARNAELEQLVTTDVLTGLRNRRFLSAELERAVSRARRHGLGLAVLLLDIDHFKRVNDEHGHAAGDEVLAAVAVRMGAALRTEDVLARWGGEEFLALAPDTGQVGAAVLAERLRAAVAAEPVAVLPDLEIPVSISVGWTTFAHGDDDQAMLRRADEALYEAKDAGRNAVRGG